MGVVDLIFQDLDLWLEVVVVAQVRVRARATPVASIAGYRVLNSKYIGLSGQGNKPVSQSSWSTTTASLWRHVSARDFRRDAL